ncbi:hypothetical protein ANTHELSMS3_05148 (plasmid) [Antarctobacter heliothermus]|uniref:Uncharacterized protein n=1 Tax=Antarctobacter heliothermus TaxID=74033 RepID=A0A222EBT0_9RHOB|nr:hypothetical protein [Antarctobacter heliothermus]ASP23528.1 hypothetical protein ANTHELSMS3_05148 [Antarctobacter heliothermus]
MTGNEGRLKHDVSQLAPSSSNGTLAPHCAAVMCDWGQPRKHGGLFTLELAGLGPLGDQHSAGDGADPGNGTQDIGSRSQVIIRDHCLLDPHFQLCNLCIEKVFQLGIHGGKHIRRSQLPLRLDLRQKPFACFEELSALCYRRLEKAQLFMWQYTSHIRSERHEARNEFRVVPVGLTACAPGC